MTPAPVRVIVSLLAAALMVGCFPSAPLDLGSPDGAATSADPEDGDAESLPTPIGEVAVAYPEEPGAWHPAVTGEPAAVDLAALWGLPLYRYDEHGQLRPGLAAAFEESQLEDGRWAVDVTLRSGRWSDGTSVTASDVVATVELLRDTREGVGLAGLEATREQERVVRFITRSRGDAWAHLLSGGFSVVKAGTTLEGLAEVPEVTGGWFSIDEYVPGRRIRFSAHRDGPLGPPRLAGVSVEFVPSFETALGALDDGDVAASFGHLALNPIDRAARVDGVRAAAPLGGTWVGLEWWRQGALGSDTVQGRDRRRAYVGAFRLGEQVDGLLQETGERMTSPIPGVSGPYRVIAPTNLAGVAVPQVLTPRWVEAPAFTARAIQRDVQTIDGDMELVRLEPDRLAREWEDRGDGALVIRRDGPRPSLLRWVGDDAELRDAAAAADGGDVTARLAVLEVLEAERYVQPLYRIGVTHVWRPDIDGFVPSSWPGLAFWNVGEWTLAGE